MDFRRSTAIGDRLGAPDAQLLIAEGYDHTWALNRPGGKVSFAARLESPRTGRVMEVFTSEPGLQLYSGNFLDGTIRGKAGRVYRRHAGLCLEAQRFPDSPRQPSFPSIVLAPGEVYRSTTIYRFLAGGC